MEVKKKTIKSALLIYTLERRLVISFLLSSLLFIPHPLQTWKGGREGLAWEVNEREDNKDEVARQRSSVYISRVDYLVFDLEHK